MGSVDANSAKAADHLGIAMVEEQRRARVQAAWAYWSYLSDTVRDVTRISATEAARSFSAVLNRVAAGEEIEIERNGAPVAVIGPPKARFISAERFRELMDGLPPVDEDFADDLRRLRAGVGPPEDPWES